jgi:tetratricopeptide (TPR) repeat protein
MALDEGLRLFREGKYEAAADVLKEDLIADDLNHKTWNALGVTYTKMGRFDEASVCFGKALDIQPETPVYLKNLAINEKKKKSFNQSLSQSSPVGKIKRPLTPLIIVLAGFFIIMFIIGSITLYLINSDTFSFKNDLMPSEPSISPEPGLPPSLYESTCEEGINLLKLERPENALIIFERAIEQNPGAARAWTGKGFALIDLGKYESAIDAFDTALENNSSYHDAQAGRQIALEALGI